MNETAITLAWTAAEAVLFGPESRLVRLPLSGDEDAPAMILESWRTEFPEVAAAQLLAGSEPAVAAGIPRLAELAREAGLRLELGAPVARAAARRTRLALPRIRINPRAVLLGALVAVAILIGSWRWSQARERVRVSRLTAAERATEERQAQSAAAGRRSQAMIEQTAALLAAVQVPRQFQSELLAALEANVPPSIVIDALEVVGDRCRLQGHLVPDAPGAAGAMDSLRRALFSPAAAWELETPVAAGPSFTWAATAAPLKKDLASPLPAPEEATAARDQLPPPAVIRSLLDELASSWKIEFRGAETQSGIERRRYDFSLAPSGGAAWSQASALVRRLKVIPSVAIERLFLAGERSASGELATVLVSAEVRTLAGNR